MNDDYMEGATDIVWGALNKMKADDILDAVSEDTADEIVRLRLSVLPEEDITDMFGCCLLSREEKEHIRRRRQAVAAFVAYCKRPMDVDDVELDRDMEIMNKMEEKLRERWGVQV